MRCAFCLTGKMGIDRNLTAGEIAGQVRVLARDLGLLDRRFNIVLMGMGEPLHNYDATMKALRILADDHGFGVSPRRVTLSTVGVLPALERLATEPFMPNLAISLHSTTEEQRDLLVPINRKYGIEDLLDACRRFPIKRRQRITFEYVMLKGVNDSLEDARRLARLLNGIRSKVNLLPLNEAAGIPFERPADDVVNRFAKTLADRGVTVSVRKSRGRDIRAACGQLITDSELADAPGRRLARAMNAEVPESLIPGQSLIATVTTFVAAPASRNLHLQIVVGDDGRAVLDREAGPGRFRPGTGGTSVPVRNRSPSTARLGRESRDQEPCRAFQSRPFPVDPSRGRRAGARAATPAGSQDCRQNRRPSRRGSQQ